MSIGLTPSTSVPLQPLIDPVAARPLFLNWIEPCRGLAILMVVANHLIGYLRSMGSIGPNLPGPGDLHGDAGVDTFLLLSGFGLVYAARMESTWQFLSRRVWRLIPAYWLVLVACWVFHLYRNAYNNDMTLAVKDLVYHATCVHLFLGFPYVNSIDPALWFMGLIVPLYLVFAMLRPALFGDKGYAVLGLAVGAAGLGGVLLIKYVPQFGTGHAPHRLPAFFIGAVVGLAYRRRDSLERLVREPWLLLGLFLGTIAPLYMGYLQFPSYLAMGLAIALLGMGLAAAADRAFVARWATVTLAAFGTIAYELYLCHQYLLLAVNAKWTTPWLVARWPDLQGPRAAMVAALLMIGLSFWVAWGVRWIIAWRDSRANWRRMLPTILVSSLLFVGLAVAYGQRMAGPPPGPSELRLAVTFLDGKPPAQAFAEPVVGWGTPGAGDLVFIAHDGAGRARVAIDHWGAPSAMTDWMDADLLVAEPWTIQLTDEQIVVRIGRVELRSVHRPYDRTAQRPLGRNDAGFTSALSIARSTVVAVP